MFERGAQDVDGASQDVALGFCVVDARSERVHLGAHLELARLGLVQGVHALGVERHLGARLERGVIRAQRALAPERARLRVRPAVRREVLAGLEALVAPGVVARVRALGAVRQRVLLEPRAALARDERAPGVRAPALAGAGRGGEGRAGDAAAREGGAGGSMNSWSTSGPPWMG